MIANNGKECSGCSACYAICPKNAIRMVDDALGFPHPVVDSSLCIGCGLCEKVCPFKETEKVERRDKFPLAYACRHKDAEEIESSRSGAAFIAISDRFVEDGGVIYGAGWGEHFRVCHKRHGDKQGLREFKGSKYAQSDMGDCFRQVKSDLEQGTRVLFSGTPCQVAGLKNFIGDRLSENLVLVDIICHGVVSPKIWDDYLTYLEEKTGLDIVSANFRDKKIFGWSGIHKESFVFSDGRTRTFDYTFFDDGIIRECCSNCKFCNLSRPSDITLGDFWGWRNCCPEDFNSDDRGCSLILCNTPKGAETFQGAADALDVIPVKTEQCLQHNLEAPTPESPLRERIAEDYVRKGFKYIRRKYGVVGLRFQVQRVMNFLKRKLKIK